MQNETPAPSPQRDRFERLYGHYQPYVHAYVARRVAAASIEDVVADCFLVAWRRIDEVPDNGLPWLYRTAANVVGTSYRSVQRWGRLKDRIAAEPDRHTVDLGERMVERDELTAALQCLSSDDRELIMLADWEGLDTADMAVVLDAKPGTVRVRLHRARGRLRSLLVADRTAEELS